MRRANLCFELGLREARVQELVRLRLVRRPCGGYRPSGAGLRRLSFVVSSSMITPLRFLRPSGMVRHRPTCDA